MAIVRNVQPPSSEGLMNLVLKRGIQSLIHPQKYIRVLKLTDGSIIRVSTLKPPSTNSTSNVPFTVSLLNLDSANHPSWNPELRDKLLLDDRGQVAKFRARYNQTASADDSGNSSVSAVDYGDFLDMDPSINLNDTGNQLTKVKAKAPVKAAQKKKK